MIIIVASRAGRSAHLVRHLRRRRLCDERRARLSTPPGAWVDLPPRAFGLGGSSSALDTLPRRARPFARFRGARGNCSGRRHSEQDSLVTHKEGGRSSGRVAFYMMLPATFGLKERCQGRTNAPAQHYELRNYGTNVIGLFF